MATKHQLEMDMIQPSNPWNPDKSVRSSSRKNNQYSYDIRGKFLRFCIGAMEGKQSPTYKQKIQFLKGEMPEWRQMKMGRQFRVWKSDKNLYLSSTECDRYDALSHCMPNGSDSSQVKAYRVIQGGEELNFSSEAEFHESLQSESMNTLD